MFEAPRLWRGLLNLFSPATSSRLEWVINESICSVTGYMLGNSLTSLIAGIVVGVTLAILGVPFALLLGVFVALVDTAALRRRPLGVGARCADDRADPVGTGRVS